MPLKFLRRKWMGSDDKAARSERIFPDCVTPVTVQRTTGYERGIYVISLGAHVGRVGYRSAQKSAP